MKHRFKSDLVLIISALIFLLSAGPVWAGSPPPQEEEEENIQGATNEDCLMCHNQSDLTYEFPSGEVWHLYVDPAKFEQSTHTANEVRCTDCHTEISGYPHPPLETSSRRFYSLEHYENCRQCHEEVYEQTLDSVHARELAAGNWDAPVCTDCHNPHYTTNPHEPRTKIPKTCSVCHSAIYDEYLESVHGAALVDENNTDVPTCVGCHGVHNQEDPTTTEFRLNSPDLCAECHADEALMDKYDISTNVFQTYVSDFHGRTVTLFDRPAPDVEPNTAVCYDCHGVHNIKSADNPQSQVYRENLLDTCQKCHPDAGDNFPASWLHHYAPDREKYPLVYYVDLFYKIFIPAVLGFMGVYVVIDAGGNILHRFVLKPDQEERETE